MKSIIIGLIALLTALQYQLWFGEGSLLSAWQLRDDIKKQTLTNNHLIEHNNKLKANIQALKKETAFLEDQARNELGMIKKGETFYQVMDNTNHQS